MNGANLYLRMLYGVWAPLYALLDRLFPFDRMRVISRVPEGRILEFGVGTGLNLQHYGRRHDVTGVDLSGAMLAQARKRHLAANLVQADAAALPFPQDSFDAAVATFFFRVLPDPKKTLAEAARVVKSGGLLIVADRFIKHRDPFAFVTIPLGWGKDRRLDHFAAGTPWKIVEEETLGSPHNLLLILKNDAK